MMNKKLYIIIGSVIFVAMFLGIFAYPYLRRLPQSAKDNPPVATTMTAAQLQADLSNYDRALSGNDISLCQNLSSRDSKMICIEEISSRTLNADTCSQISEAEDKKACVDKVVFNKMTAASDLAGCEKIENGMLARRCVETIAKEGKNVDCGSLKDMDDKNSCLSITLYESAKLDKDLSKCASIPEAIMKANCLSELSQIDLHGDTDKDGLDFLQEIIRGTDPNKIDTDKDGHPDAEEVLAGFSPVGEGKLNELVPSDSINCNDIPDPKLKASCFLEVKDQSFPYLHCNKIKEYNLRTFCLEKYSLPRQ